MAFDGKIVGELTSTNPEILKSYAEVGLQTLSDARSVPTIGKPSSEFGGFTDEAVYRPLVSNSQPFVVDPEVWKRLSLSSDQTMKVRLTFRAHLGNVCHLVGDQLKPLPYKDEDAKIVTSYRSRTGWAIARVHLEGAVDCADTEAGFELEDSWFAVTPDIDARFLGEGMWLVDSGDYDNDGHSEIVFSINRYNRGGYELFYDTFKKHAVFEYSYH